MSLIRVSQPVKYPTQQDVLDPSFISNYGRPAGLWTPTFGGANIAYDFSGNGHNGTLNGSISTTASGWGTLGAAWNFDGSTGYISFPAPYDLSSSSFSYCFVLTPTANTFNHHLYGANTNGPPQIGFGSSTQLLIGTVGAGNFAAGNVNLVAGVTYVVAITFNSGAWAIYVNGKKDTSGTTATTFTNATTRYIAFTNGSIKTQIGVSLTIDFKSALTASQVSSLYSTLMYGVP